jgi:hypothetical protein
MRPEHFQAVLGATFVRTSGEVVLQIGSRQYDRFRLGEIGVPQIKAARTLHLVLQRMAIASPSALAARVHELMTLEGVGHAAFYAALAVLADCDQEDRALVNVERAAKGKTPDTLVTFSTVKARERQRRFVHKRQTNPRQRRDR